MCKCLWNSWVWLHLGHIALQRCCSNDSLQQFWASAFYMVVCWHRLGEVDNECTSQNSIILAIHVPKFIKFGGDLTKFWQKQFRTFFGQPCRNVLAVDCSIWSALLIVCWFTLACCRYYWTSSRRCRWRSRAWRRRCVSCRTKMWSLSLAGWHWRRRTPIEWMPRTKNLCEWSRSRNDLNCWGLQLMELRTSLSAPSQGNQFDADLWSAVLCSCLYKVE